MRKEVENLPDQPKSNLLYRFLRSYLLILVPVLTVSFLVSNHMLRSLKQTTYQNVSTQIDKVCAELNSLYASYTGSSYALASDSYLEGAFWATNSKRYHAISAIRSASKYDMTTESIFLYCGDGSLYTSFGVVRKDVYLTNTLNLSSSDCQALSELLDSLQDAAVPLLSARARGGGYLLLHFGVPANISTNSFSVNFLINFNEVCSILAPVASGCPVNIDLTFSDGSTVRFSGDQNGIALLQEEPLEGHYTSIQSQAAVMGASLEVRYRSDLLYEEVLRSQQLSFLILILGLLASAAISIWFSKRRMNGVKKLEAVIQGSPVEFRRGDEFAFIGSMLRRSVSESASLTSSIRSYRSILRQQTMRMLASGVLRERPAVNQLLQSCGMELVEDYFFIGGIVMEGPEELFRETLQLMSGDLICETDLCGRRGLIFLAELPNPDEDRSMRLETASRLQEVLAGCGARNIRVGMSQVYQELFMAEIAFRETVELLEKDSASCTPVCFEQMMDPHSRVARLNQGDLKAFAESIEKRDLDTADVCLQRMERSISSACSSESNQAYLRYCILQCLLSAIGNTGSGSEELLREAVCLDMNDGGSFGTEIRRLLHKYCAEPAAPMEFEAILAYIQEHYSDYNLSAGEVAEYAGIDKSHLSRYFKSNINMTYIDYLTHLRLEKARELLETTELPVTEIVARVGYSDHSSFRRKFKAMYGYSVADCRQKLPESIAE